MSLWERGGKPPGGRKPLVVALVDSATEGEELFTHFCRLSYDGNTYRWKDFAGTVDAALEVQQTIQRGTGQ